MADKVALIDSLCAKARILPVITIAREQDVLPLADALAAGGLTALEVTLRSEFGLKAIQILREQRLSCAPVPAPCSTATCSRRRKWPVRSSSSPRALPATCWKPRAQPDPAAAGHQQCLRHHGRLRPGLSPLQAVPGGSQRRRCGDQGLGGPFGEVKFCPTGGVGPANIKSYMALKNVMCVGGSWMLDPEWIKNGDWARIQEVTAEGLALLD
jgi:2-dehydro-3-deoxyphosphogluconate aldolase/(4S)-4-hydroxy-2-oxoglutarate aldolase